MKKILLSLCLCLSLSLSLQAQEAPRVLFIGNSYTEVNNLPALVQAVSQSAGHDISYQSNTPGGCTFQQHCSNNSMTLIQQGGWDYVVLQEQSQYPSFPWGQVSSGCFPYAAQLCQAVYQYNPQAEAMFYMTWGRQSGDPQWDSIATYEGMDDRLYRAYMYMKEQNDASVCPVGRVWRYIREHIPTIELYSSDGSHPSMAGSYAAACSFYTMLFHENPLNITHVPSGVDGATAQQIRVATKLMVYDSLDRWMRYSPAGDTTIVSDTTLSHDTVVITNTIYITIHDTVYIHDTIYIDNPSSIDPVFGDEVLFVEYFDLMGRRLEGTLPKGPVLVRYTTRQGSYTRKTILR